MKCFTCSIALYDAKTLILWKTDQKYFESFKMWCCGRIYIIWTYRVRNEHLWGTGDVYTGFWWGGT